MPTSKQRLNVTLPKHIAIYLKKISLRDDVSQSRKALELIEKALEIEEDEYLSKLADERVRKGGKYLSHEQVWK